MKAHFWILAFAVVISISSLFLIDRLLARGGTENGPIQKSPVLLSDQHISSKVSIQQANGLHGIPRESKHLPTLLEGSLSIVADSPNPLPKSERESLWYAFSEARRTIYPLTDRQRELAENAGAYFFAQNPGQEVVARFMDDGVQFSSGYAGREWTGALSLSGLIPHEIRHEGTVLEYHYNGIVEWIENRPEGFRQGWVLEGRPIESNDTQMRLPVSVTGLTVEQLESNDSDSSGFQFINAAGEPVLSYTGLMAWDANGQILESAMQPTTEGLEILVADSGAVYPITIDPLIASLEQKLGPEVTGDGGPSDEFGLSVSVAGDIALVGALNDDDNGSSSGAAYVFVRNGGNWSFEQKLRASDGASFDRFGISVSVSGNTALIGADRNDDGGSSSGSAYIFVRNGEVWSEQQKLTANDAAEGDEFGISVSISGETALVGARGDGSGSAYVFARSGSSWSEQQKLTVTNAAADARFGHAVSLSSDTALIGAYQDDANGSESGSAYVFVRTGTTWSEQHKLTAIDAAPNDRFGYAVSLSENTALIGAYQDDAKGSDSGSAYVFVREGVNWSEQQKLTADDGAEDDRFGWSVSVSEEIALVGAPRDDDLGTSTGSAYVFVRSGTNWSEEQKLIADDTSAGDRFGSSVSVSGDTAMIGAPRDDDGHNNAGSAYILIRDGTSWSQDEKFISGDNAEDDQFGFSVSLDGDTALIGVPGDNEAGSDSGCAYVFERTGNEWNQQAKLIASDGAAGDRFGVSVSVSGNIALVGAHLDDDGKDNSGSAYAFARIGTVWTQEQKLTANDAEEEALFGFSVSVSGATALIAAPKDENHGSRSGSAYVFLRDGTSWSAQQKLIADDGDQGDDFGFSVSIDNDTALIGAPGDNDSDSGSGSAYVFVRDGASWSQKKKLLANDGESGDGFGRSVSICENTALVGASAGNGIENNTGSAYVFVREANNWSQQKELSASDGVRGDGFGVSVSVSGSLAVIGANFDSDDAEFSGSAYVFRRDGTDWTEEQKLTAINGTEDDFFGFSVSVSGDTALIGVDQAEGLNASGFTSEDQGAVYVFRIVEDRDQGSDAWQLANGFNPDVPNDEATLDSDGDGDLDILEIFQGTDRNDSSDRFGFQNVGATNNSLSATFRRSTVQAAVNAQSSWSTDLVNWYTTGQTDGDITIALSEEVVEIGTGFQIVELEAEVIGGNTEKLFIALSLSPNE
ncbi:MAG: FG-GAP repeat protein [Verrucomicrobiota bacterium]